MMITRDALDRNYRMMVLGLAVYENQNVEYYSGGDLEKRILTHPTKEGEFKDKIKKTVSTGWVNPYKAAYLWFKGELLDMVGIAEALAGRDTVIKQQQSVENKKRSDQSELDKLILGKTTLKSIFKSKSGKESEVIHLQASIDLSTKDIEDYRTLINFLTIYHGQVAIQEFKREKANAYLRILNSFSGREIQNSVVSATIWQELMDSGFNNSGGANANTQPS
jgi:hypothetical protein